MENTIDKLKVLEAISNLIEEKINDLKEYSFSSKENVIKIEALCEIYRKFNR